MYRIYKKILHSDEGDTKILIKSGMFSKKKCFGSLKMREVSHVCNKKAHRVKKIFFYNLFLYVQNIVSQKLTCIVMQ